MNSTHKNNLKSCGACFSNKSYISSKEIIANWLNSHESTSTYPDIVEVVFKNKRKEFYINKSNLKLKVGNNVLVESHPGHDIGKVNMLDELFINPIMKQNLQENYQNLKKIYAIAKKHDIKKLEEARSLEAPALIKARKIINDLKLDMKLSDVEYQGDKLKAYFYYIADERVDFRKLIKVLAEEFKIQIVMKQIGARQESSYVGGLGVCGRQFCCSSWLCKLDSVPTDNVRNQGLSLNSQRLIGQCGKLKCCLNYELKTYIDAKKKFPSNKSSIITEQGKAIFQKSDILKGIMWYSYEDNLQKQIPLKIKQVINLIQLNKKGVKVKSLPSNDHEEIMLEKK